ncbi:MAG: serine/threonine-protein kinase, partial [Dehalococcoidia bacterium]
MYPQVLKGHYRLGRELGRGGMGLVFEGVDRRDDSRVAVKLLHSYLAEADETYRERFEREAHIAALLRSPYTVHLMDFGVEQGYPFIVMEFIEGTTLAAAMKEGPLEPARALRIATETARALEEASARGVTHRDIKPENILLDMEGRVKVTDFGIARQAVSSGLTSTGVFVGTPTYAAPEQAEGQADQRSDIYSLGATLYAMIAGRPPYSGRTGAEVIRQHRDAALPMAPLAGLPDAVANIIRRCLEKEPLDRYQTASELAGALERARQAITRNTPVPPRPAPPPPAAQRPAAPAPPTVVAPPPHTQEQGATVAYSAAAPPAADPAVSVPPPLWTTDEPTTVDPAHRPAPTPRPVAPVTAASQPTVTAGQATVVQRAAATVVAPPPPPAYVPGPAAPAPVPQQQAGGRGGSRNILLAAIGGVALIAGGAVAVFAMAGGGGDDPPAGGGDSDGSPTAAATASPTSGPPSPTPLPSVTPPAGVPSQLGSGVRATVVG